MKSQLILTVLAALAMNACSQSESNQPTSFNKEKIEKAIADGKTTPQESAEEMALAAEQLAQSASFAYAQRLAKLSLAVDANNVRAKLWLAILAPTMELKGFMTRIEPMAQKNPARYKKYLEAKQQMSDEIPVKAVKDFFFNGPKDIQSEDEIQDTISAVTLRMDELRQTLKDLKNEELTIYRNPDNVTQEERWKEAQKSCTASSERGTITLHGCDLSNAYQVKVNAADFEVMAQGVAGYQVYIGLLNTYSAHGVVDVAEASNGRTSLADVVSRLSNDAKFGTLRDGRTLGIIPDLAVDAVLAARSAVQIERDLCAQQGQPTWKRDGYLISEGSCALPADGFEAALQTIEAVAKGPAVVTLRVNEKVRPTRVNVPKFTKNPPKNLRDLSPVVVTDNCGHELLIPTEPTLGGLLPDSDLAAILTPSCH